MLRERKELLFRSARTEKCRCRRGVRWFKGEPGSESRLVRLSKECKHEQHGRRVSVTSGKSHATLPLRSKGAAAKPRRSSGTDPTWPLLRRGRPPPAHPPLPLTIGRALFKATGNSCFLLVEICEIKGGGEDGGSRGIEGVQNFVYEQGSGGLTGTGGDGDLDYDRWA